MRGVRQALMWVKTSLSRRQYLTPARPTLSSALGAYATPDCLMTIGALPGNQTRLIDHTYTPLGRAVRTYTTPSTVTSRSKSDPIASPS